ncbi:MAG: hypothetical protein HY550_02795 [Elusimicrobia bacterium]|nr:hypothetical protein [Elusimicrobiota bacterium]
MNNNIPPAGDNSYAGQFSKKFWIRIALLSIPIWIFLFGFFYVETLLEAKDMNAAGAWGTLVAIVALPPAAACALMIAVLAVIELFRFPPQRKR